MKKLSIPLLILAVIYIFMTFFVGNIVEKEIKSTLSSFKTSDVSVELLNYERHFFSATATSNVLLKVDAETILEMQVSSTILHYPYQALIKNNVQIMDATLAKKAERYFATENWLVSESRIDLFSQLHGSLTLGAGKYESDTETLVTEPLQLSYQVDLNQKRGDFQLDWAGLTGVSYGTKLDLRSVQLDAQLDLLLQQGGDDYQLQVDKIALHHEGNDSLLEGLLLKGSNQLGKVAQTIDSSNELLLDSYQLNGEQQQTYSDNRIQFSLIGLNQPALELLNRSYDGEAEVETALIELIRSGVQVTLTQLHSQTPWGAIQGEFDITLDEGTPLVDIIANPYVLFDFISGKASLALPLSLLNEPVLTEALQMGLMTGFLVQDEDSLNVQTSFLSGELIVNGQVIPL